MKRFLLKDYAGIYTLPNVDVTKELPSLYLSRSFTNSNNHRNLFIFIKLFRLPDIAANMLIITLNNYQLVGFPSSAGTCFVGFDSLFISPEIRG